MLGMFTENDRVNAQKEFDCYGYNHKLAIEQIALAYFRKAAIYFENVSRSLHALADYKANKETSDEAWLKWKQIEGERHQAELIKEQLELNDKEIASRRAWY